MRILHILDHSIPLHSGYTFRTRALLREQRARGWETLHLTSPKQGPATDLEETVDGLRFFRTPWKPRPWEEFPAVRERAQMKATARRMAQICAEHTPDLIHAHSPVLNALPALEVGQRLGIPVVYEIRAFWEDAAVDHGTHRENSLRYRAIRAMETRALRRVDHAFTICEGLRADIVARGIPASKVTVIPNAVDVENFSLGQPADPELKRRLGLENRTVIGFIGSFYAYEGLDLLLDALPALTRRVPDAAVLLVGGGPQEVALKAQAARLGLEGQIVFTGRVPHSEVTRYYDLVDVFAYPRKSMRLTELVTPLKPLEAMAQGHLLAASAVGGHRELIRNGETGVLFEPDNPAALADALAGLLSRRDSWDAFRRNGRRFVETERTWTRSTEGYIEPYARLTGRRLSKVSA
ncbi:MAG: glycosyltransferase, exosortase A system-associated [Burkholderiales bacterium]|nr:glycosyltransferase, exosortase A system-associated [Burkholderiales bacterium]